MLKIKKDKKSKEFWDFVRKTAQEVDKWPDWKKGPARTREDRRPGVRKGDR